MLDIQGQPNAAAQPAVPQPAAPKPALTMIPSVSGGTTKIVQWTLGFVVVLFLISGGYLSFVQAQKQSEIDAKTKDVKTLRQQLGTPDRVKAEATANQLKQSVAVLQTALAASSSWTAFLTEITSRVPSGVTLTNLATSDGFAVRVNGNAISYEELAQFITALQSSERFTDVTLESASMSQTQTGSSVTFSAKATFVPATTSASSTAGGTSATK